MTTAPFVLEQVSSVHLVADVFIDGGQQLTVVVTVNDEQKKAVHEGLIAAAKNPELDKSTPDEMEESKKEPFIPADELLHATE